MKISISCSKCFDERGIKNFKFKSMDVNDDGLYNLECEHGHKTITVLQNEKFEVLFDKGALALIDGYKQEAVACLAASLERFHEWCTLIFLANNNINFEEYEKTWNLVAKQSERQLGAFYFLYLQEFKKAPINFGVKMKTYKNDFVNFRNNVIHNGYIPECEEVVEYGEFLLKYIYDILKVMKVKYEKSILDISFYRQKRLEKYRNKYDMKTPMLIPTILGLYSGEKDYGNKTYLEAMNNLKEMYDKLSLLTDL